MLGTPRVLSSILAISLLAYFFLLHGSRLQHRALDLLVDGLDRARGADILRGIAHEVAAYVITISVINAVLGALVTGALLWLVRVKCCSRTGIRQSMNSPTLHRCWLGYV